MASSSPLANSTENIFRCSVCLDQFKELRLLPCLHRYCMDCLKTIIQANNDGTFKCSICRTICTIPENGIHGFKTDFHITRRLELMELKKSLESNDLKQCVSCSKNLKVSGYCFKCMDFLCDLCYQFHISNRIVNDHQPHTLNLNSIDTKNITVETLVTVMEDPKCHIHRKHQAQLCCSTCGNVPICATCVIGVHKGHTLHDVFELAKSERKSLRSTLLEVNNHKSKLYELPMKVKLAKQKLRENAAEKSANIQIQYEQQANKIKDKLNKNTAEREKDDTDIGNRREEEIYQARISFEEEMNHMEQKYDHESKEIKEKYDAIENKLNIKLDHLEGDLKNLTAAKELLTQQNEKGLQEILDNYEQIIKRYENFTVTTSSILASKDEWTDAQCIPDIRAASEPLITEMKKEIPDLESLSDFIISDVPIVIFYINVKIAEKEESIIDVAGFSEGNRIDSVSHTGDGNMVITGPNTSDESSYIAVINRQGKIQQLEGIENESSSNHYCCYISEFKVATVCIPAEITIYDVRFGFTKREYKYYSSSSFVRCIATDIVNNHIIVGTSSRDLYVYDYDLNYSHNITLPDVISYPRDIIVHGDNLLVCDDRRKGAYAVHMRGSAGSELMYEFTKPVCTSTNGAFRCKPISVCTDKKGFIYMLWERLGFHPGRILTQYSQDGRQLLTTRLVDTNSRCMTTLESDETETLVIATADTAKLYTFRLSVT